MGKGFGTLWVILGSVFARVVEVVVILVSFESDGKRMEDILGRESVAISPMKVVEHTRKNEILDY